MRFLVGAATGVAEEILFQLATSAQGDWECLDWEQIGLAGLFGGLSAVGLGSKIGNWFKKWLKRGNFGGKGVASVDELLAMMNKRRGVDAGYATGEVEAYFRKMGVLGSHYKQDGITTIRLLKEGASRRTAFHEWLHKFLQGRNGGNYRPGEDKIIEDFLERHKDFLGL